MEDLVAQSLFDFSAEGVLSKGRGFEFRPQQQQLAAAVATALQQERSLLAEAGTGVGKSLAYLLPAVRFALEHGRKAIISTHTINLQEQLFSKDIPTVAKASGLSFRAALLKGRASSADARARMGEELWGRMAFRTADGMGHHRQGAFTDLQ